MRILGFCRYLAQYGWRPFVLTTDANSVYPSVGIDKELFAGLPNSVQVEVVPYTDPRLRLIALRDRIRNILSASFSAEDRGRQKTPLQTERTTSRMRWISEIKRLLLCWALSFPDPQCYWFRPAAKRLSWIEKDKIPDVVLATGPPWTGLLIGKALAERFRVPFVADFRDPWISKHYNSFLPPLLVRKAGELERSVCAAAACVIANTEELRELFCERYPDFRDKFVSIPNGFDRRLLSTTGIECNDLNGSDKLHMNGRMLELWHFGTLYSKRNPLPLFQAVSELLGQGQIRPDQLRIRLVGGWDIADEHCEKLALELENQGIVRREGPVPHQVCLEQMARAQTLLVLQPNFPLQVPAKIYEYIATARPLIVLGGEGATARLVNEHHLGITCPNTTADIRRLIYQLVTGQLTLNPPQVAQTNRFDYRILAGDLAQVLEDVCTRHSN